MSHTVTGFKGLWTSPVDGDTDPGHLVVADNIAFYRPGMLEPRRGFEALGADLANTWNRAVVFEGSLIAHHGTASISRWTGSAWSAYSGTFTPPSGQKVRFWESAGSLFVNTTEGVYELDDATTGAWRLTGSPPALQGTATLRRTTSESGGFTSADGQWAYRLVWAYKNLNDRLQLGAPSGRFLLTVPANVTATTGNIAKLNGSTTVTVTNTTHGFATGEYVDVTLGGAETYFAAGRFQVTVVSSTSFTYSDATNNGSGITQNPGADITYGFSSRNASITAPIPSSVTTSYFVQLYRSVKSASASTEPNDALALVYERNPTNVEVTAGSMTIADVTPDEIRGAELYTSVGTVLDAKYRPPACADAVEFQGSVFCGSTYQTHALELQILGVGGTYGIQSGETIFFSDSPSDLSANTWSFTVTSGATESATVFQLYTTGSAAQNIANTARSMVRVINARASNTKLYAEYVSSDIEAPGKIRLYGRSPSVTQFAAFVDGPAESTTANAFAPVLTQVNYITGAGISRAGSTVTVDTTYNHGYVVGQEIQLLESSNTSHFPNGTKTVASVVDPNTFTYTEAGSAVAAEANTGYFLDRVTQTVKSTNTTRTNGLMWSPPGEPWAFPLVNLALVGTGTVKRVLPGRDRLFLLTTKGAYQLTGSWPNFSITEYDTTLNLVAYDLAAAQGGRVYGLFDAGFLELGDSARVADYAINKDIRELMASASSAVATYGFAVPYESENFILFFMPDSSDDTASQQAYVLRTDTGDWTRWPISNVMTGVVSPADDKVYLGLSNGKTWKERKARTRSDQQDPSGSFNVIAESIAQDAGKPGEQKVWGQAGVFTFRNAEFTTMGLAFRTDLSPDLSTVMTLAPPGSTYSTETKPIDFWVPKSWMRGSRISWRLTHGTASERFAIQSLDLDYRVCRPVSTR